MTNLLEMNQYPSICSSLCKRNVSIIIYDNRQVDLIFKITTEFLQTYVGGGDIYRIESTVKMINEEAGVIDS